MPAQDRGYEDSAVRLTRGQRLGIAIAAPLLFLAIRLLAATWRVRSVAGAGHLDAIVAGGGALIPCCWHQRLFFCVRYLLSRRSQGLNAGFIVSPSRDGEFASRIVTRFGATVIRGSATRTGARALRDLHEVIKQGVSPVSHPDGPTGPPRQAKPGSPILAQIAGVALLPMAFSADRYWQFNSWDRLILPKPFAHITLVVGAPITVDKNDRLDIATETLQTALETVTAQADRAAGVTPAVARDKKA